MIKTHSTLSKMDAINIRLLVENDWDLIAINENTITIDGHLLLVPSTKVLEQIFNIVRDKPQCKGFIEYMKNKGRFKKFYTELGDPDKIKMMAAILGEKDVDE